MIFYSNSSSESLNDLDAQSDFDKKRCHKKAGQVEPFLSWICSNLYTPLCEDSKIFVCNTITMLALSTIEEGFVAKHLHAMKLIEDCLFCKTNLKFSFTKALLNKFSSANYKMIEKNYR